MFNAPTRKEIAAARKIAKSEFVVNSLLSVDNDPKTQKSNASGQGILTAIQYLTPGDKFGVNMCVSASDGCLGGCLDTAGNPVYAKAKRQARDNRTRLFIQARPIYSTLLYAEIAAFCFKCDKLGLKPAIRLNGTSDVVWERTAPWVFEHFKHVQFYDYTKHSVRVKRDWFSKRVPDNYHLTMSRSETNENECLEVIEDNPRMKVTVVFSTQRTRDLPQTWNGYRVGDGDKTDLRFLDKGFRIVGLRAKGKARKDTTGFVVSV